MSASLASLRRHFAMWLAHRRADRLLFQLSPERLEEFERLRVEGGFETRKELLNNAITLLKWAINHTNAGHTVAAVDEKMQLYFELEMPCLRRRR